MPESVKMCGTCRFRGQPDTEMPCKDCTPDFSHYAKPVNLEELQKAEQAVLEAITSLRKTEARLLEEKLKLENALMRLTLVRGEGYGK